MRAQRLDQSLGKHGAPVAPALAVAHRDLAALEVHVLDAQAQPLQQPHASGVEQARREPARAVELREQRAHLVFRQHHRNARRALGTHDAFHPRQLLLQDLPIKEEERRQRLVLRRRRAAPLGREMRKERFDFQPAHVARVALGVEVDEAAHPVQVRLLRAQAVVLHPQALAVLLEQFRLRHVLRPSQVPILYERTCRAPG